MLTDDLALVREADPGGADFVRFAARYADADLLAQWAGALNGGGQASVRAVAYIDNSREHAALLFFLLARRISPVVLPPGSPDEESQNLARRIEASCILRLNAANELIVDWLCPANDERGCEAPDVAGIYLLTSGSTGQPSIIFRSVNSWRHEAERYIRLLDLCPTNHVVLVSPIYHAYALGWLWAVAEAGCSLEVFRPTELARIIDALRTRATHVALTPFLASLLARRAGSGTKPARLAVVMAGAGPVDEALETDFGRAFGIGLARNYGSTETGALFASVTPLPPLYIGRPMPNVKLLSQVPPGQTFLLVVELEDGRVISVGDILCEDDHGYLVIGRETMAIRRGEAWISPYEIEAILRSSPLVEDCEVRSIRSSNGSGNDHIIATVVPRQDVPCEAELRRFCSERLRLNKVPDLIECVDVIRRTKSGKTARSPVYRWTDPGRIVEAAGAYKQSVLLFALAETIGLARLDGATSVDEIAFRAGVHAGSLGELLDVAARLGLLEEAETRTTTPLPCGAAEVVSLERDAASQWNTVEGLATIIQQGRLKRPFSTQTPSPTFRERYRRAMDGPHKQRAAQLVLRKLRTMLPAPYTLLDVSATGGAYSKRFADSGLLVQGRCLAVGGLGTVDEGSPVPQLTSMADALSDEEPLDLIVLDNAIHELHVALHLSQLAERLKPNGAIVIDDLFLGHDSGATIGVDWMTHGGMCHVAQDSVDLSMHDLGFDKHRIVETSRPLHHSVGIYTRT